MELEDIPLQNLQIRQRSREAKRRRSRIFTSVNLRKEKSEHSRSNSLDDNQFLSDIKAKNKPRTQQSAQKAWLKRQHKSTSLSNYVKANRVNLLEQINNKLPPLKVIAQQCIRPTLKHHHTNGTSTVKSRAKVHQYVKPLTAGAILHHKTQTSVSKAQPIPTIDINSYIQSDIAVLKEFSFCVPDLNLYVIKVKKEQQARSIVNRKKWLTFPAQNNPLD